MCFTLVCHKLFGDNFFSLLFWAETYMLCALVYFTQERHFSRIRKKTEFPNRPHCNNYSLLATPYIYEHRMRFPNIRGHKKWRPRSVTESSTRRLFQVYTVCNHWKITVFCHLALIAPYFNIRQNVFQMLIDVGLHCLKCLMVWNLIESPIYTCTWRYQY